MSDDDTKTSDQDVVEDLDPKVNDVSVPMWMMGMLIVFLWAGFLFLDRRAGGFNAQVYRPYPSLEYVKAIGGSEDPRISRGKAIYSMNCAACHQANGGGVTGQFPPLRGSDWVTAPKTDRLVRVAMNGLKGTIHINGEPFNESGAAVMLSVGVDGKFTPEQMADLLSYIRAGEDIGNSAPMVSADDIAEAMAAAEARGKIQWTEAELLEFPVE